VTSWWLHVFPWSVEWNSTSLFPSGSSFASSFVASTYSAQIEWSGATYTLGQLVLVSRALYDPALYRVNVWPSSDETYAHSVPFACTGVEKSSEPPSFVQNAYTYLVPLSAAGRHHPESFSVYPVGSKVPAPS